MEFSFFLLAKNKNKLDGILQGYPNPYTKPKDRLNQSLDQLHRARSNAANYIKTETYTYKHPTTRKTANSF